MSIQQATDCRICRVCDGGPGNDGPCLCGLRAWEDACERAWRSYEARLGNKTASEEAAIYGAWHSGWTAAQKAARETPAHD